MSTDFRARIALHNAQVELEALKSECRGMVWANEFGMQHGGQPIYGQQAFDDLAAKIRATKVQIDDAITLERIGS